jgi:succinate dehydrogenase/fumarate reductase flavoprotein subunit
MSTSDYSTVSFDADVLVVGGGIGGLAAAIAAAEAGVSVIVLEKSNTRRSGLAGSGVDHIQAYIPEFHGKIGYSVEDFAEDQFTIGGNLGGLCRHDLSDMFCRRSATDVRRLEDWGVQFRFDNGRRPGGFHIVPQFHHVPTSYNFAGRDIKVVLTRKAKELGVRIVNRSHVRQLLKSADGSAVTGAIGVSTRIRELQVVHAKAVILATSGVTSRLGVNSTSPETFEGFSQPGSATGAGKLLAAKAGATITDLEFFGSTEGYNFNNYSFSVGLPGGSWWPTGRVVDEDGEVVVERLYDVDEDDPDYIAKYRKIIDDFSPQRPKVARLLKEGRKLYFDLQDGTDDEREHIWWALSHEGKTNVLRHHMEKNGIDVKNWHKLRFPLRPGGKGSPITAGIWVKDDTLETEVNNLFASGNEPGGSWSAIPVAGGALVFGFRAGEVAAERARGLASTALAPTFAGSVETEMTDASVQQIISQSEAILARAGDQGGIGWYEAERSLQTLLDTELRLPHSNGALAQTLTILRREKARLSEGIVAANPHELSRAFEVLDLYDLAELVVFAILERKGSLGPFKKVETDGEAPEEYGISIAIGYADGNPAASRRRIIPPHP